MSDRGDYHLTCRLSGGRDCWRSVFPSRSSSSRAEVEGAELEPAGAGPEGGRCVCEGGSGLRRLGAAGMSASMLSDDWRETEGEVRRLSLWT